VSVGQSSEM